jgi:cyanophycin synthetase
MDINKNLNFDSIKIIDIKYLRKNNIWNYDNTIQILIDVGDFKNIYTNQLNGLYENLLIQMPSLIEHRCGTGEKQGFFTRVNEGITIAHLLEHIIVEVSSFCLNWKGIGKTRKTDTDGYYYIAIYSGIVDENKMKECVGCGLEILQNILSGKKFLMCEYKNRIILKYDHVNYSKFIYPFLNKTNYPFIYKNNYDYIQIGLGINQHRVLNGFFDSSNSISNSILSNEDYYKSILEEYNIEVVKPYYTENIEDCLKVFNEINSSVIIKPYYKKKSLHGIKKNINDIDQLKNSYNYSITHNLFKSSKVIIQKYYEHGIFSSIIIDSKIICTYKLEFIEKDIELLGNGTNTIMELIDENLTQKILLSNEQKNKFIENDLFCDYDYLFEYISKNNIDIKMILNNNQKINIKKRFIHPIEILNISKNIQKKICLPTQILNLKYYEIKYFVGDDKIDSDSKNTNIIVLNIKQNLNLCLASCCTNYYSKIFNEFFNPNKNYNIPILGIIGSGNKSYINKMISKFFIYIGKYTCSCDDYNYLINGTNTNMNNKNKWENVELALVNNRTEMVVFNIDSDDYVNEGIYCKNYNPIIIGNINMEFDDVYYPIKYKQNTMKLLGYFLENYNKNGFIVLNADDPNIFNFINYCEEKQFITNPKFIFYTTKHFRNIFSENHQKLESHSIVFIENNTVYLKNFIGIIELVKINSNSNIEQLVIIIASIWSVYDIYSFENKNIFINFYNTQSWL